MYKFEAYDQNANLLFESEPIYTQETIWEEVDDVWACNEEVAGLEIVKADGTDRLVLVQV